MKKEESLYDLKVLSKRIAELRKESKVTLAKLSDKMEEKTGEYISANTLGKYENIGEAEKMGISNLIAIANFYNVPLDYLLGRTNSRMYEFNKREISNTLGLSDNAIKKLTALSNNKTRSNRTFKLDLLNYIISDDTFLNDLSLNLSDYYNSYKDKRSKDEEKRKNYKATKYELNEIFEDFIDNSYADLYENKRPKPYNLF